MIEERIIKEAKKINLPDLFRQKNINLTSTNSGNFFKALCPFHEDKTPSLNLSLKNGVWLWNCFGCGAGGTLIDFIMKMDNVNFKNAVEILTNDNINVGAGLAPAQSKNLPPRSSENRDKLLQMIVNHYHNILTNGDTKGKAYLEKRGLLDSEIIKTFKLGYSNNDANTVLNKYRVALRSEIGIFKFNYHETFANCVIFPVLDLEGNPTDLYARRIVNYSGRANHCYNKGQHKGIFNHSNVLNAETIILTEGIIDALSIYKAGFKNVTALFGTNGFTKAHEKLFNNEKVKGIIFALDNDQAGKEAVFRLSEKFKKVSLKIAQLPENIKDFNELLLKEGIKAIKESIESASKISNFKSPISSSVIFSENEESIFRFEGKDLIYKTQEADFIVRNVLSLKNIEHSLRLITTVKKGRQVYTDRIDFYLSRSRKGFVTAVSRYFDLQPAVVESCLIDIMNHIEEDFKIRKEKELKPDLKEMTEAEKREALSFLKGKDLLKEVKRDLETLGYVGENANKILLYLCGTSRKQKKPLNILIRSQSSSGKSFLIETICSLMPEEDVHAITSLSPQALYYMPENGLKHKFIAIDEKHGAGEAEYPIRSLQSGGKLSRAVPVKNPSTNLTETKYITKEGPISYVDGSTDTSSNSENANRCFEIYLDESHIQTKAVQNEQKKTYTLESLALDEIREAIRKKHKNAQRLLRSIKVIIPYVYLINFPCEWLRTRRDHDRFLSLISCVTFLHQYQRPIKYFNAGAELASAQYIESTVYDYEVAYKIASVVLFNTFRELEKPLFDFYLKLQEMVKELAEKNNIEAEEFWFTRKTIRGHLKIEDYLLKRYMRQLKDLEYFAVKSSGNGSKDQYKLAIKVNKDVLLKGLTTPLELRNKLNAKGTTKDKDVDFK